MQVILREKDQQQKEQRQQYCDPFQTKLVGGEFITADWTKFALRVDHHRARRAFFLFHSLKLILFS
jgi:hypothetical protein